MSLSPTLSRPRSPPYGRLPGPALAPGNLKREEALINSYEAEEERIVNMLSRKLEQLREEKITLERVHEEEEEAKVNRLARELAVLRVWQHQAQSQAQSQSHLANNDDAPIAGPSSGLAASINGLAANGAPPGPSTTVLLDTLKKENDNLRERLGSVETEFVRLTRLNEVYREELIQHRRRLGISVDNLIGLSSATDPYSQPTHRRAPSLTSSSSSPTASMVALPTFRPSSTTHSVPIPRSSTTTQSRRVHAHAYAPQPSIPESTLSLSPSSLSSPSPAPSPYLDLSPVLSAQPASYASGATHLTTPPSSASLRDTPPAPYGAPVTGLSYPSVPPPSLSSSLGSPVVMTHMPQAQAQERRYSHGSRRTSVERGARIAETGTLVRSRAGSATSGSGAGTAELGGFVPSLDETRE